MDTLVDAGLLHHSSETGEIIPSRPPDKISSRVIVETVLGTETPDTLGGEQAAHAVEGATERFTEHEAGARPSSPAPPDNSGGPASAEQNKT
ncbi:MAG: hypothetical protein P8X86_10220 [Desulfofustis sp.]